VAADEHFRRKESGYQLEETVVPGKHGSFKSWMILEGHRSLTGMLPFVVAMEEGCYGL